MFCDNEEFQKCHNMYDMKELQKSIKLNMEHKKIRCYVRKRKVIY